MTKFAFSFLAIQEWPAVPILWQRTFKKFLFVMRLTALFLIVSLFSANATSIAQKISISGTNLTYKQLFNTIKQQTGYAVLGTEELLKSKRTIALKTDNLELFQFIELILKDIPYNYDIQGRTIFITKNQSTHYATTISPAAIDQPPINISVTDADGNPLSGATVYNKKTKKSSITDNNGDVKINVSNGDIIEVSFIGYEKQSITIKDINELTIKLIKKNAELDAVTINAGIITRKKGTFTGSATTISGTQLREVGNQNIIQALRSLDPSFKILDNNLTGADPNALAQIELRGKTSITKTTNLGTLTDQFAIDPNTPLFILDGFESSLRQIIDLDINRIASITILKDAASTALYGARSANGVVVVETIKAKAGELRVNYSGDFNLSVADLRDYNLMNASEKLEFERLAGYYSPNINFGYEAYYMLGVFYNQRLKAIKQGVDTYWLNEPLRKVAFNNSHSVYANGGSEEFQYGIGMNVQNITGLMKGSGRNNWGARADLTYRKNKLNIINRIFISGNRADQSPYGNFSTYARINPYYKKKIEGRYVEHIPAGIDGRSLEPVPNPLYNAMLNSENYAKSISLQNNLGFNYDINHSIRLSGAFQLTKSIDNSIYFLSPQDTKFDNTPILEKGTYTNTATNAFSYNGNVALTYNKVIAEKHVLTGNARAEIQESNNEVLGFTAVGFPLGVNGNPSYAYSYQPNSKPMISTPPTIRRVNVLGSINYAFNNRFFADATYRIDGSTAFGTANKYSPFYALGLGWSLHNESFMEAFKYVNTLILRANRGSSGNQNFGSFASATVYNLEGNRNYFGQGLYHASIGNAHLNWQKTLQTNLGFDLGMFNNRLTTVVNVYHKITDPLIVIIDLPGSNGISSYPTNAGNLLVKGVEATISYSPIFRLDKRTVWTLSLMGSKYNSKYNGFGNVMNNLNEEQKRSNSIQRFTDGKSPDDIWGMESKGIDPSSGREVFVKKDGSYTFEYDPSDIKVLANSRPVVEGVISSSLRVKGFTFNAYIRYNLGGSRFNNALYNKVENISYEGLSYNQDKRALELRWKQPGDIAQFKGISLSDFSPISSRFIQKENIITGESISMGYELQASSSSLLRRMQFQSLRFSGSMNNIFRISNIVSERGIDYPFSNAIAVSINANF